MAGENQRGPLIDVGLHFIASEAIAFHLEFDAKVCLQRSKDALGDEIVFKLESWIAHLKEGTAISLGQSISHSATHVEDSACWMDAHSRKPM